MTPRLLIVGAEGEVLPGELLRRLGATCVGRIGSWSDLLGIGPELRIDAVIWLDPPLADQRWVEELVRFQHQRPHTGVVLVPRRAELVGPTEVEILSRRERGQLRHVTAAPRDLPGLADGLRRVLAETGRLPGGDVEMRGPDIDLRRLRAPGPERPGGALTDVALPSAGGRVVTILGPKGGTGKTTVAVALAYLASLLAPRRVLLIDLDTERADVAVHLDLMDAPDLVDLLPQLEQEPTRLPLYGERLFVVPGPSRPDLAELVTPAAVERALASLPAHFRWIIVDTGARLSDEIAYRAVERAEQLVLVLSPEVTALRTARLLLDHAERLGWTSKGVSLVLNQAYERAPLSPERIGRFLGRRIEHRIPFDRAAIDGAILAGRPLVQTQPSHPISQALRRLAAGLGVDVDVRDLATVQPLVTRWRTWWQGQRREKLERFDRSS